MAIGVPPGPVNVKAKPWEDGSLEPSLAGAGVGWEGMEWGLAMLDVTQQHWGARFRRGTSFYS